MKKTADKNKKIVAFIMMQIALFIVSFGAVCSKMAGRQVFMSIPFFVYYGLLLITLFAYAIIWQQVLKHIPLLVAYACKGVGMVYGILWGVVFFGETITLKVVISAILVITGVYIIVFDGLVEKDYD